MKFKCSVKTFKLIFPDISRLEAVAIGTALLLVFDVWILIGFLRGGGLL